MKKLSQKAKNIIVICLVCAVCVSTVAVFLPLTLLKKRNNTMLDTPQNIGVYSVMKDFYVEVDAVDGAKQYFFTISPPIGDDVTLSSQTNQLKITQVMFEPGVYFVKSYVKGSSEQSRSLYSEYVKYTRILQLEAPILFIEGFVLKWNEVQKAESYVLNVISQTGTSEYELDSSDITIINNVVYYDFSNQNFPQNSIIYIRSKSSANFVELSQPSNGVTVT